VPSSYPLGQIVKHNFRFGDDVIGGGETQGSDGSLSAVGARGAK